MVLDANMTVSDSWLYLLKRSLALKCEACMGSRNYFFSVMHGGI